MPRVESVNRVSSAVPVTPSRAGWPALPARTAAPASKGDAEPGRALFVLFCIYVLVLVGRPQDLVPALAPLRLVLVLTGLTVLATLVRKQGSGVSFFGAPETKLFLAFYAATFIGIPFAVHRRVAYEFLVEEYTASIIMHLLFLAHVTTVTKFKQVVSVLAVSSLAFTVVGLSQGEILGGRFYVNSPMYDTNDVAYVELALMAFPLSLVTGAYGWVKKLWAVPTVILGMLLLLFTGSRGGLLGFATFIALFMFLKIPRVGKILKMGFVVVLIGATLANIDKINVERYQTLRTIETDYNWEQFGRMEIWERGVRLFAENPIVGVGVNCFAIAISDMREREIGIPRWQPSHSSYIQVLTETGLLGTIPFICLIGVTVLNFNRLRRIENMPDKNVSGLSGLLLVSYLAQLVAAAFLTLAFSVFFTLMFSLSAAMRHIAENMKREAESAG